MHHIALRPPVYPSQTSYTPGTLKGEDFYISQDMPGDKLFQEGVLTFYKEVEKIRNSINEVLKPNGSQAMPARSCYDLFLCNPTFEEGMYTRVDRNFKATLL